MQLLLFNFKTELRKDIDADIKKNFQENLKPLKEKIEGLKTRIHRFDKELKKNIIVYGLKEDVHEDYELSENTVLNLLINDLKLSITENNTEYVESIGKKSEKPRPMLVKLNNLRYKLRILKLNKKLCDIKVSVVDNFTKEELKIRKDLLLKMQEARREDKCAVIRDTKLITEDWKKPQKNKKRLPESPNSPDANKNKKFNAQKHR